MRFVDRIQQATSHPTFKFTSLVLLFVTLLVGALLTLSLHELIHIKCAYGGECFGEVEWLVQASLLPFAVLLGLICGVVLLLLSFVAAVFSRQANAASNLFGFHHDAGILRQTAVFYLAIGIVIFMVFFLFANLII